MPHACCVCVAVAVAMRHCGVPLKLDNLTVHRAWELAEYWDRNVGRRAPLCVLVARQSQLGFRAAAPLQSLMGRHCHGSVCPK